MKQVILVLSLFLFSCSTEKTETPTPKETKTVYLPSWNDTPHKQRIIDFVNQVTDNKHANYVAPENRIAVFDNDGTLWTEKPLYNHFFSVFARFEELIKAHPELAKEEPYASIHQFVQTQDKKSLGYFMEELKNEEFNKIVGDLMGVPFNGMTPEEFRTWNQNFYSTWKHPKFGLSVDQTTYLPMIELINYLKDHDFKCYIFTADEGDFLKIYSSELYGIPPEQVLGSSIQYAYNEGNLTRTDQGNWVNNWDNKAKLIQNVIGQKPVIAAGNSNGDHEMLAYTNAQNAPHLSILIHHTDSVRETAYDSHLDRVMPYATSHQYLIVDIANDWKTIFNK